MPVLPATLFTARTQPGAVWWVKQVGAVQVPLPASQ